MEQIFSGKLHKMRTVLETVPMYFLKSHLGEIYLNDYIGKTVKLEFQNGYECMACDKSINKIFGQGFCYPCFMNAPENAPCIVRPELCEAHLGKGRDVAWEERNHNQTHYVYLAKSSSIKVGITRATNIPYRWIDQGAIEGVVIAEVPYRQLCGDIEVALKEHFTDKTSWQKMLKNNVTDDDLLEAREFAIENIPEEFEPYMLFDEEPIKINFPVEQYPLKVKSQKLDKVEVLEGELMGIKGQYLYFDFDRVINIRSHSGYLANIYA